MREIYTVFQLELTQRLRSSKWRWALGLWLVVLLGLVALQFGYVQANQPNIPGVEEPDAAGAIAGFNLLILMLVGLVIAPALAATAINGDRRDGVLALVQATPVKAHQLVIAKLLAAWFASLLFLVVSLPVLLGLLAFGDIRWWDLVLGLVVVALVLLAVCVMALGFSAIAAGPVASTLMSYLVLVAVLIGIPIVVLMSLPFTATNEQRPVAQITDYSVEDYGAVPTEQWCEVVTREDTSVQPHRVGWLLYGQPLLLLSDALPTGSFGDSPTTWGRMLLMQANAKPQESDQRASTCEQLQQELTETPRSVTDNFGVWGDTGREPKYQRAETTPGRGWLAALAVYLGVGFTGAVLAWRRLRVPLRRLAKDDRIA